ncbi:MAG: zinc-binding dehydrogenase [Actinomycetota bacterium]|nr:zinc-binding dehydrogenase [Actinomycetota bacterium]
MKAALFDTHGGPEVLRYDDVTDPSPGPGEVVVKVGAVTLNHGPDTMVRSGTFRLPIPLPHVSGSDPAGEVVAVGVGVDASLIGQRAGVEPIIACGECDFCLAGAGENYCRAWLLLGVHRWGGRAEYVVVPARNLVALPGNVGFDQAACLGMAYLTVYHGLVRKAQIRADDTLLVLGAGGGVGVAAIQIARDAGARVIAVTGEPWKRERTRSIGADVALTLADADWPAQVLEATNGRGASVLFDNVGTATWPQSLPLLDRAGRFVCSGATTGFELSLDAIALYRNNITAYFHMCGPRADLAELVQLVGDGRIDPVIDSRFPLSDAAGAEARLAARAQFGKIVLVPDSVLETSSLGAQAAGAAVPAPR